MQLEERRGEATLDVQAISRELLRAWRGRRSQVQLSRRLGFRSNVLYAWESGRAYPTAAQALRVAKLTGVDLRAALERFYRDVPPGIGKLEPASRAGVAALLTELRGRMQIGELARRSGHSRFAVARWLKGSCEPRLPEFLALVEASSLRLLDYLSTLIDANKLPSIAERWSLLEAGREAAYAEPWTQAVLLVLELDTYREHNRRHDSRWIARQLGTQVETVERCIELLARTEQIRWDGTHWALARVLTIDTRRDRAAGLAIKRCWAAVGIERIERGAAGIFGYNVFTISNADLQRLRELHQAYFSQMRAIIAESRPPERVVVTNLQLFALDE